MSEMPVHRLVLVQFETSNFTFTAYAWSEVIGREMLRQAWATHVAQTGADPAYLDEFYDDVNVHEVNIPGVLRDGSPIAVGDVNGCDDSPSVDDIVAFSRDHRIGFDIGPDKPEFSMDEVCALLHYHLGVQAFVEYTGGGCATIFAGRIDPDTMHYPAVAGPGWFEKGISNGLGKATASWHEFAVGPERDDHPQFADQLVSPGDYWITNTRQIAALIALYVIDAADFDNVTAIGLDATQRGIPQNGA